MRVTKYNPAFRDQDGSYLNEEWTSFSDIGTVYEGAIFTLEDYTRVEDAYIESVLVFLNETGTSTVRVEELEKHEVSGLNEVEMGQYENIKEGLLISTTDLPDIIRLILREHVWCSLRGDRGVSVRFGYDYYMYFLADLDIDGIRSKINSLGLYVD